mmetsp:Transcript_7068/g.8131  ORF Transcript_7068/g.8131 Transcript_7068/m.8131 type:complete len:287 (+) Transcript_7068:300-1160(+)|eukprot:CAMPEP_0197855908 /NCGR_PEP_ID=MMETSP1438-20131217/27502_1 /TAXON_ID=1461541 /ORGANISM="Pterosperma sp., Strain CCMP1384" /LENGTH=286 /DNA_ID=CAMNT_0043471171 /DNA_START=193 /DNA_END=1053 /DNA_ORIENTATION=-
MYERGTAFKSEATAKAMSKAASATGKYRTVQLPKVDQESEHLIVAILSIIQADSEHANKVITQWDQKVAKARKIYSHASRTLLESKIRVELLTRMTHMLSTTTDAAEIAANGAARCFGVSLASSALETQFKANKEELALATRTCELAASEKEKAGEYLAKAEKSLSEYRTKWLQNRTRMLSNMSTGNLKRLHEDFPKQFSKLQMKMKVDEDGHNEEIREKLTQYDSLRRKNLKKSSSAQSLVSASSKEADQQQASKTVTQTEASPKEEGSQQPVFTSSMNNPLFDA